MAKQYPIAQMSIFLSFTRLQLISNPDFPLISADIDSKKANKLFTSSSAAFTPSIELRKALRATSASI